MMKTPQDYVEEFGQKWYEAENGGETFDTSKYFLTSLEEYGKQCEEKGKREGLYYEGFEDGEEKGRNDVVDYIKKHRNTVCVTPSVYLGERPFYYEIPQFVLDEARTLTK